MLVLLSEGLLLSKSRPRGSSRLARGKEPCLSEQPAFCRRAQENGGASLETSSGQQMRCRTLDAPFYLFHRFFHFWCQSIGVSGMLYIWEDAVCRECVEAWGEERVF